MKTRTNQPIDLIVVSNDKIKQLTDAQCNSLKQGDIILKKTGKQYHTYVVSYKGEGTGEGMCLTYTASGYIETISYDFTGGHWVYNSTDIFNAEDYAKTSQLADKQDKLVSGTNIKTINSQSLLGSGNIAISGGTKLYKHEVSVEDMSLIIEDTPTKHYRLIIQFISNLSSQPTSLQLKQIIMTYLKADNVDADHRFIPLFFALNDSDYADEYGMLVCRYILGASNLSFYTGRETIEKTFNFDTYDDIQFDLIEDDIMGL